MNRKPGNSYVSELFAGKGPSVDGQARILPSYPPHSRHVHRELYYLPTALEA
jgi:hypothetical protein